MKTSLGSDREQLQWSAGDLSNELAAIPSPPRRVRRHRGYFVLVGRWVMLVPFAMFLFIYVQIAVGTVRLMWFSELVPATVTQAEIEPDGRGRT